MPSHSSHCLQPLDVSCFAPLKQVYGQQVQTSMQLGINHIDKQSFLTLYQYSQTKALSAANICSGFSATGLVPYNPRQVLDRLEISNITPPNSSHDIWTAKIITGSNHTTDRVRALQPGNQEWVTAIESINASGWLLPPMIIFAGKIH